MLRLTYRLYRLGSRARHWGTRRLTPAGWLAFSGLLASGAIGINMDQTVAFQGFALLACLLAVSLSAACFFRGRFAVHRLLPRFGTVGQPLVYGVRVQNETAKIFRDLELLEDLADSRPTLAEFLAEQQASTRKGSSRLEEPRWRLMHSAQATFKPIPLPGLPSKGEVEVRAELLPLKRGPLRFTGATLARPDPLGLFRGFVHRPLPQTLLILPKRYPLPSIALPGSRKYQQGGVALAAPIGESDEFVSLRDYRPGDPLRRLHWRSWAHAGRPLVKEFQDEFFVRHALVLDTLVGQERSQAFEEAVSIAASFACTVNTQESLLDLMFVGPQAVCFTTGRGLGQAEQALEILAAVRCAGDKPFRALQDLVLEHARLVCGCICIFLDWDGPRRELVRQLQAVGLSLLVLIVAEAPEAQRIRSTSAEDQPENFHVLEVGQIAEQLQAIKG
ncbi:MAG TPA: DUF58 domain-containing protein [Candidatus Binatia bacterium]|nr:MAG: DUF58 domain-containing protein [Verrucomicrobiota bacterium]HYV32694.1 DUF58 domain-containing protein [Candidatus Binatia bacterium]